ncbi:MAG: hypothetical protein JW716_01555 [Candidatus Aenigmarchaeota archaeon]|nr:hypothetical protein [Candidatus Aenigmarchaeota archaeon]
MLDSRKIFLASGIMAVLLVLITSINASALGIAPAISEHAFSPGMEKTISLKIVNSEHKDVSVFLSVDGELADFVTIDTPEFDMAKDMDFMKVTYTFKLPDDIGKPGPHEARILINTKIASGEARGTQIAAKVVVYSVLKVFVPYPGEYAEIRLIAPNFRVGKESFFGIEINNLGTDDILTDSLINVLSPLNAKIASLKGDRTAVKSKGTELISIGWTPDTQGNMLAVSEVIYGQSFARDEKRFTVGNPIIEIFNISAENFRLGGIAKFEIIAQNMWNELIDDVYASFTIMDEQGNLYSKYSSEHVEVPAGGVQIIPGYLETNELSEGKFLMKITLNYLDKKEEKVFDINVRRDSISIVPTGQVISAQTPDKASETDNMYMLFYFVIVLIVISNIVLYKKLSGGRKEKYVSKLGQ